MKSAPSAASHSAQHKEMESITNTEAETQVRDPMETITGGSTLSTTALGEANEPFWRAVAVQSSWMEHE